MKESFFSEVESDFYRYLTGEGGVNRHSRTNYMSWLKFLSESYPLPESLSEGDISDILASEETLRRSRSKYRTQRDMINFKSALRKYRAFLGSDFRQRQEDTVLAETKKILDDKTLPKTERTALSRSRIGQGLFRDRLIGFWHGCSVTAFPRHDVLTASHIRPWRKSDNRQRLDVFNGLLLLPNLDRLFDKGYISFLDNGGIVFSSFFPKSDRGLLGLDGSLRLRFVDDRHRPYLKYHRENCLMA